jgi:type IV pilus assembly protein PilV
MRTSKSPSRAARGFSMIEVLVSVLVFALGMLGIAALQATALRNSQSAFERSQGVVETYSILDSMRANRDAALIGQYDLATWTCERPGAATLASNDIGDWIDSLQENLGPTACGKIKCGSDECFIEVRWDDSRGTEGADAEAVTEAKEYTVVTRTLL